MIRAIIAAAALLTATPALAHDATSGWQYPWECCHDRDCHQVAEQAVTEDAAGFTVVVDGRTFFVKHVGAKLSPDGHYHACHMEGAAELSCFFYPPKGF